MSVSHQQSSTVVSHSSRRRIACLRPIFVAENDRSQLALEDGICPRGEGPVVKGGRVVPHSFLGAVVSACCLDVGFWERDLGLLWSVSARKVSKKTVRT